MSYSIIVNPHVHMSLYQRETYKKINSTSLLTVMFSEKKRYRIHREYWMILTQYVMKMESRNHRSLILASIKQDLFYTYVRDLNAPCRDLSVIV